MQTEQTQPFSTCVLDHLLIITTSTSSLGHPVLISPHKTRYSNPCSSCINHFLCPGSSLTWLPYWTPHHRLSSAMATSRENVLGAEVDDMISNFFSTESDLSSVPSQLDERAVHERVASYLPKGPDDQTREVLTSFWSFFYQMMASKCLLSLLSSWMMNNCIVYTGICSLPFWCKVNPMLNLNCVLIPNLVLLIYIVKAHSVTPQMTASSFKDFHEELEITASSMGVTPAEAVQKLLRMICLRWDGFRCVATGLLELNAVKAGLVSANPSQYPCDNELAHVIPFSIGHWEDRKQVRQNLLLQYYKYWLTAGLQSVSDLDHSQKVLSACRPWSPGH